MEELDDVKAVMDQLGGLAMIGSADMPARIFALWAGALKHLVDAMIVGGGGPKSAVDLFRNEDPADPQRWKRMYDLLGFCIERMEMLAATQPRPPEPLSVPEP